MTTFAVNFWGSHPDAGNDDCWTGEDFDTEAAAKAAYDHPTFDSYCPARDVAYIELARVENGTEVTRLAVRKNPECDPKLQAWAERHNAEEWQREIAREEGMLGGVEAYNDAMGY